MCKGFENSRKFRFPDRITSKIPKENYNKTLKASEFDIDSRFRKCRIEIVYNEGMQDGKQWDSISFSC